MPPPPLFRTEKAYKYFSDSVAKHRVPGRSDDDDSYRTTAVGPTGCRRVL